MARHRDCGAAANVSAATTRPHQFDDAALLEAVGERGDGWWVMGLRAELLRTPVRTPLAQAER